MFYNPNINSFFFFFLDFSMCNNLLKSNLQHSNMTILAKCCVAIMSISISIQIYFACSTIFTFNKKTYIVMSAQHVHNPLFPMSKTPWSQTIKFPTVIHISLSNPVCQSVLTACSQLAFWVFCLSSWTQTEDLDTSGMDLYRPIFQRQRLDTSMYWLSSMGGYFLFSHSNCCSQWAQHEGRGVDRLQISYSL